MYIYLPFRSSRCYHFLGTDVNDELNQFRSEKKIGRGESVNNIQKKKKKGLVLFYLRVSTSIK